MVSESETHQGLSFAFYLRHPTANNRHNDTFSYRISGRNRRSWQASSFDRQRSHLRSSREYLQAASSSTLPCICLPSCRHTLRAPSVSPRLPLCSCPPTSRLSETPIWSQ